MQTSNVQNHINRNHRRINTPQYPLYKDSMDSTRFLRPVEEIKGSDGSRQFKVKVFWSDSRGWRFGGTSVLPVKLFHQSNSTSAIAFIEVR